LVEIEPKWPRKRGKGRKTQVVKAGLPPQWVASCLLKKLDTSFTRAQMWQQYNKLRTANTADMDAEELMTHREALRLMKKDLNFATQNAAEVQDEDDE
jgi:3-hydroxyisobutyrate dehydrogenase-like beta-hydroxyacid dehydrogenase